MKVFYKIRTIEERTMVKSGKSHYRILIADRNPHVRAYLKREILAEGYQVALARSCQEVMEEIVGSRIIDIIILDPDLPDAETASLSWKLKSRTPNIPIIIHTLSHKEIKGFHHQPGEIIVKKGGESAEQLKIALQRIVNRSVGHEGLYENR